MNGIAALRGYDKLSLAPIMSKKPKEPVSPAPASKLTHSPFAALSKQDIQVADNAAIPAAPEPVTTQAAPEKSGKSKGRLVLRRETKHRGGKAVIVVTGLELLKNFDAKAIDGLAKELKQTLGCGGTVEESSSGTQIVLQGDKPAKVAELLRARGFRVDGVTS